MNPYANRGDLTTGEIRPHLVRMTVPMVWGILSIISFQLVNTFYVSMLGTQKLAAITFTFPVTFTIFAVFMGFGIAMSSVISRLIGEKRHEDIRRVATHGLVMVVMASLVVTVLGILLMNPLFLAMGASEKDILLIDDYMSIYYIGTTMICMPIVGNAAIRASGNTKVPAIIMASAALANAVIDPILIFGLFGFPRLELQGAAISTVLSNGCAMLAGLYVLKKKDIVCKSYLYNLRQFSDSAKRLLIVALPAGLTSAFPAILNSVIISLLSQSGPGPVAAYGVASRIEAFVFVIMMALSVGMGPIIGQNWGAGRYDRVKETLRQALLFCVIWSVFVAFVLAIFGKPIAAMFSSDAEVQHVLILYFLIIPISYPLSNIASGWGSAFNAMGKAHYAAAMIFIKMIVLMIPAAYLGYHFYGITGLFISLAVVNIITGIVFHIFGWSRCNHPALKVNA